MSVVASRCQIDALGDSASNVLINEWIDTVKDDPINNFTDAASYAISLIENITDAVTA